MTMNTTDRAVRKIIISQLISTYAGAVDKVGIGVDSCSLLNEAIQSANI